MTKLTQKQEKSLKLDALREFLRDGPKNNSEMVCHLGITLARLRYYVLEMESVGDVVIEKRPSRTGKPNIIVHLTERGRNKSPVKIERSLVVSGDCPWWKYANIGAGNAQTKTE